MDQSPEDLRQAKSSLRQVVFEQVVEAHLTAPSKTRRSSIAKLAPTPLNIVGLGIGEKVTSESFTGDRCLKIYVQRKVAEKSLPEGLQLPREIDGIPTDIESVGIIKALSCTADPKRRQDRPVPAGVSIGAAGQGAGTLGYLTRDATNRRYLLSNFHVIGNIRQPDQRNHIFQPGQDDGNLGPGDLVARQAGRHVPIDFAGDNRIDAAIAELVDDEAARSFLCGLGPIAGITTAREDSPVRIFGKTSRHSKGHIDDVDADIVVRYGSRRAQFRDQLKISPKHPTRFFARLGDSGSLLVTGSPGRRLACGLLFASGGIGGVAFANPISSVLAALGIELAL